MAVSMPVLMASPQPSSQCPSSHSSVPREGGTCPASQANTPTALTDSVGRDAYVRPYLVGIQAIHGVPVELMVTDFEGKEVARNGDLSFTKAERDILLTSLASGEITSQIMKGDEGNSLLLSAPVTYTRTGTVEGAVWLKTSLTQLLQADGYVLRIGEMSDPAPRNTVTAAIALPPSMASLSMSTSLTTI